MMKQGNISRIHKSSKLILISVVVWLALVFIGIWPWIHQIDLSDFVLSVLAHFSAVIWWIVLLWALQHLAYQLGALLVGKPQQTAPNPEEPVVTVLYVTCDDFNAACCQSCLDQDYSKLRVLVCDDSSQAPYQKMVKGFCSKQRSKCRLITRPTHQGFKAGNLNHAMKNHVKSEWVLLVDADQLLHRKYVSQLVARLPADYSDIAFVQAAHEGAINNGNSAFQVALSPGVSLYYQRDLPLREDFGFVPLLGHGSLIRKSVWEAIGEFPEIVSEDFAFALRAADHGFRGTCVRDVVSQEDFPYDFTGFMIRLRKFAGGTAELWRHEGIRFFKGTATFVEKWDFTFQLLWYVLMPFVLLNSFLGGYVVYRLWNQGIQYLHPVLPYLYTWLLVTLFALNVSVTQGISDAVRFYFWSTAVYTAGMPLAAFSFVKHLFCQPAFNRTPKNHENGKLNRMESSVIVVLGATALICAIVWWSPFSPVLFGYGCAYLSYPLYEHLTMPSKFGGLSRLLIYLPGICMLIGILTMWWVYGRY